MPKINRFGGATFALAALGFAAVAVPAAASSAPGGDVRYDGANRSSLASSAALLATALPLTRAANLPVVYSAAQKSLQEFSVRIEEARTRPGLDATKTGSVASSFFGTVAIPFSPIGSRDDWDRVRSAAPVSAMTGCETLACETRLKKVKAAVAAGDDEGFFEKLSAVNVLVNRSITYAPDKRVYGQLDHWADGAETMRMGAGDCEDFAILKLSLLREMGVPARSMSLVVLRDTARGLYHAVLAVSTNKGHFILDNVRNEVYRDVAANHYMPLYSFSADRSWIHGKPSGEMIASAPSGMPLGSITPGESALTALDVADFWAGLQEEIRPTAAF